LMTSGSGMLNPLRIRYFTHRSVKLMQICS
jgi:hypothetical protein